MNEIGTQWDLRHEPIRDYNISLNDIFGSTYLNYLAEDQPESHLQRIGFLLK